MVSGASRETNGERLRAKQSPPSTVSTKPKKLVDEYIEHKRQSLSRERHERR